MQRSAPTVATSPLDQSGLFPPFTKSTLWPCLPGARFQNFREKEGGRQQKKKKKELEVEKEGEGKENE